MKKPAQKGRREGKELTQSGVGNPEEPAGTQMGQLSAQRPTRAPRTVPLKRLLQLSWPVHSPDFPTYSPSIAV